MGVWGRGETELRQLVIDRFDALMETWPVYATFLGVHEHDGQLADLSREAKLADMDAERAFISDLEGLDDATLTETDRFERDVALFSARLRLFDAEVTRGWERRVSAAAEIGDALFLLLARDLAPAPQRLESMTRRLEGVPQALEQIRDRLVEPVRLWNELEMREATELPGLVDEILTLAREQLPARSAELERLELAATEAKTALVDYANWIGDRLAVAGDVVALGSDDLDALIALRAFDGLDTDDILAIGEEQLELMHEARREAGRAIDPAATEEEVVDRVKSDGPADFDDALEAYRDSMMRARRHIETSDLATLPPDERLDVLPTPRYMRSSIPLAAYFEGTAFDRPIQGVYIVTPSVEGDAGAMREHNWASIVNTSVHEAYPGHHLQFSAALTAATPSRLLVEAPEFHEGWGMYCEQMMLEEGFEDSPQRRVIVATDAIWRACRIILDIKLQRGQINVADAVDFLVEQTGFERPVARAEVQRYTQMPTYNLSYLLGKVLIGRLRDDERSRLGASFQLKRFHDALLYSGSLPISFHRRLLAGEGGGPTLPPVTQP